MLSCGARNQSEEESEIEPGDESCIGSAEVFAKEQKPAVASDVAKLKQKVEDTRRGLVAIADDGSGLQLGNAWRATKALIGRILLYITEWEHDFPNLLDGRHLREMQALIHAASSEQEYSTDVSGHLARICTARIWPEWEALLAGLSVYDLTGSLVFRTPLSQAVSLTVAQVKHEIFLRNKIHPLFQQLCVGDTEVKDAEQLGSIFNRHGAVAFAHVCCYVNPGRFRNVFGRWRLQKQTSIVKYNDDLTEITVRPSGVTDCRGETSELGVTVRTWQDEVVFSYKSKTLWVTERDGKGPELKYIAESGVIHYFENVDEES